jgi:acyl CoA:acetate/3-ketoacid CoA transferase beta subunit
MNLSPDELMVVCMSRQIHNGEIVVQGIATPLVAAAYLLARKIHAPDLYFASAIGQSLCHHPAPMSISYVESLWLDRALSSVGFVRSAADILPSLRPKEFFRPAQIDKHGNFNNIAFGADYTRPKLRLPGTGGIPDVTTYSDEVYLYIPRHSRVTFVNKVDFISGLGYHPARKYGKGPQYLITDLGQFDFANGVLRLTSLHPGISIQRIKAKTQFDFEISEDLHDTILPTSLELQILRDEIDPLSIRRLEQLSGAARRKLLQEILSKEQIQ